VCYRVTKLSIFALFFNPFYSLNVFLSGKDRKTLAISSFSPFKKHPKNRYPKKSTFWISKN